jgi:histidinol dehydrogenase
MSWLKQAQSKTEVPVDQSVPSIVTGIINDIHVRGDEAVRDYSKKFDKWSPSSFELSLQEIQGIIKTVPAQTIKDIKEVQQNVRKFALAQREAVKDIEIEMSPGVFLGHKNIPIQSVGAYIPGGRYPLLASAHMT